MFERFSDRAKKVMSLANQEAQRLKREYIGTEHVLLGLVMEGSGVGVSVLKHLGVDLANVRSEVEKLKAEAPKTETMGKLPQTPRTKTVIMFAVDEARGLGHNYVGTEHLLLGLLREREGSAAQVLTNLGLEVEHVRTEVLTQLETDSDVEVHVYEGYAEAQAGTTNHAPGATGYIVGPCPHCGQPVHWDLKSS